MQHAGGEIPFAFGRERHGRVGAACGDQRQPVGDRIDPARFDAGPGLLPDALLEQAAACDEQRAFERLPAGHLDRLVVEEGAVPTNGVEELAGRRVEHGAEHGLAFLHQRRRYGPFRHVAKKGVGPVDRIDHPHQAPLEPRRVVLRFLRQPAVIRPAAEQRCLQRFVDGNVGVAHLGAVVLSPHRDLLAEIAMRELAGLLDRRLQQTKVLLERVGRRDTGVGKRGHLSVSTRLSKPCRQEVPDTRH